MDWLHFSAGATTTVILEGTRQLQTSKAKLDVSLKQFGSILQVLFHCWRSGGIAGLGAHNAMAGGIAVASGFLAGATLQWAVQVGASPILRDSRDRRCWRSARVYLVLMRNSTTSGICSRGIVNSILWHAVCVGIRFVGQTTVSNDCPLLFPLIWFFSS